MSLLAAIQGGAAAARQVIADSGFAAQLALTHYTGSPTGRDATTGEQVRPSVSESGIAMVDRPELRVMRLNPDVVATDLQLLCFSEDFTEIDIGDVAVITETRTFNGTYRVKWVIADPSETIWQVIVSQ